MQLIKKLTFAPLFLVILGITCFQIDKVLSDSTILFSLNLSDLYKLILFCFLISFVIVFLLLKRELNVYINFSPTALFTPSIKLLATLVVVTFSLTFYLISSNDTSKNGFALPDSLIDTALKFVPQMEVDSQQG